MGHRGDDGADRHDCGRPEGVGRAAARLWHFLRAVPVAAVLQWLDDRGPSMGAAIAFYTVFSLGPTLLLVVVLAGSVFGSAAAEQAILVEFGELLGPEGARAVQAMLRGARALDEGTLAAWIGVALLLVAATTVFAEIHGALNVIFRAAPPPWSTLAWMIRVRLAGMALIVVMGFFLLVALVISAGLAAFQGWLTERAPELFAALWLASNVVSLAVTLLLFVAAYRILPDARLPLRDLCFGAAVAAVLFSFGKGLIASYVGSADAVTVLGAAGAPIVVLLWVYYSVQIFLLGAAMAKRLHDYRRPEGGEALGLRS